MSRKILIGLAAGALALAGCKQAETPTPAQTPETPATAGLPASNHDFQPAIDAGDFTELVKVLAWYDNEWAFANRMLDVMVAWLRP